MRNWKNKSRSDDRSHGLKPEARKYPVSRRHTKGPVMLSCVPWALGTFQPRVSTRGSAAVFRVPLALLFAFLFPAVHAQVPQAQTPQTQTPQPHSNAAD